MKIIILSSLIGGLLLTQSTCVADKTTNLSPIDPSRLVVMDGHVQKHSPTRFLVRDNVRASLEQKTLQNSAEISFTYEGPSKQMTALTSGELRRQIGLKLRAQDTCNIVYVMWHIEPDQGILVQVKNNPGQNTNAQCGDRGYSIVKPTFLHQPAPIKVDQERILRASIEGQTLQVFADGSLVWSGTLPTEAFSFDGPAGIRSDNGNFDVEMRVQQ